MIRITELRLPLEHPADALPAAIVERLGVTATDLLDYQVFKRGYDARKRDAIVRLLMAVAPGWMRAGYAP